MSGFLVSSTGLAWLLIGPGCWLGWQLLRQNGRILLRLDELEKRLDELEFGGPEQQAGSRGEEAPPEKSEIERRLVVPALRSSITENGAATTNGGRHARANRFGNRSLAHSNIKRDGLKAGTAAPDFRLPCLAGSEVSLQNFRGRPLLLVFSDPHCGPCNTLAPKLEKFHREQADITVVMISRGGPKENRAKVKKHGLTFPLLLQERWEISRLYAIFATPIAYLIDESGITTHDVAIGVEPILALIGKVAATARIPARSGTTQATKLSTKGTERVVGG